MVRILCHLFMLLLLYSLYQGQEQKVLPAFLPILSKLLSSFQTVGLSSVHNLNSKKLGLIFYIICNSNVNCQNYFIIFLFIQVKDLLRIWI